MTRLLTVRDVERAVHIARTSLIDAQVRQRLERIHVRAYATEFMHAEDELFVALFLKGQIGCTRTPRARVTPTAA